MACEIVAFYSEATQDTSFSIKRVHPTCDWDDGTRKSSIGHSFSFTSENDKKICQAKFYLRRIGSFTGTLKAVLYGCCVVGGGCLPCYYRYHWEPVWFNVEDPLAISDSIDVSTVPTGSYQLITFTFSGDQQHLMRSDINYIIQVQAYSGDFDDNNYILVGLDANPASPSGNISYFGSCVPLCEGDCWGAWSGQDPLNIATCFYVYGEDSTPTYGLPTLLCGRCDHDAAMLWSGWWVNHLTREYAIEAGMDEIQLRSSETTRTKYIWALDEDSDIIYFSSSGHGNTTKFTGHQLEDIFWKDEAETARIASGRHFNFMSCSMGTDLAPYLCTSGAIGVHAYNVVYTFWIDASDFPNSYSEYFFRSHCETDIKLIQGQTHGQAHTACITKYQEYLDDPDVPEFIKPALLADKNGKMFCGTSGAVLWTPSTPATPTNLQATCPTSTSVQLTWEDNATGEDTYYVERNDGGWHVIATIAANSTSHTDTVTCDTAYLYRVRCKTGVIYSGYATLSETITCTCPVSSPPAPTGLYVACRADKYSPTTTHISTYLIWVDNAINETSYTIQRKRWEKIGWHTIATLPVNSTSYQDDSVTCNVTYQYRVRCSNSNGDSAWDTHIPVNCPCSKEADVVGGVPRYVEGLICGSCGAELGQDSFHCTRSPFGSLTCFCNKCGGRVYP